MAPALKLGALDEPPLRRLLLAQAASRVGDYIVLAATPFAVFSIGGRAAQVGVVFATGSVSVVVLLFLGGAIADRVRRRSVMVFADLLRFGCQGTLSALLISGDAQLWQLLVLQVSQGAGTALFLPAATGLMPAAVSPQRLQEANSLRGIVLAGAAMTGPALAGVLIAAAAPGWAFALDALSFLLSAALLARLRLLREEPPRAERSLVAELAEGWAEFRARTWLWAVVAEFSLLNALAFAPFAVLGASVADASLGGPGAWAAILTAAGLGELGGCVIALRWRPQRPLFAITLIIASWAAPLLLLAVAAAVAAIAAAAAAAGASLGLFGAIWETTLQTHVPARQLSRLSSYDWLGSLALLPIGYLLAGSAEAAVGAAPALLCAAVLVLLCTAAVVALPSVRRLRASEPRRAIALAPALSGSAASR